MNSHRISRHGGGDASGFTLIELLVALAVTLVIAGGIATAVPRARPAFDRVPAELELHQRGRTALDVLAQSVRAAGKTVASANLLGPLAELVPVVSLGVPDVSGAFTSMTVIAPVANASEGLLASDQASPSGSITLAVTPCPNVKDVCGFTPGAVAVIADTEGHHDVFIVASTNPGARRLTPNHALSHTYRAGAVVAEVEQNTFSLVPQADGTRSLIRETAAGAIQPVADFFSTLTFELESHQVNIVLTVDAPTDALRRALGSRVFRTSVRLRNVS